MTVEVRGCGDDGGEPIDAKQPMTRGVNIRSEVTHGEQRRGTKRRKVEAAG